MKSTQRGLGRGISALIPESGTVNFGSYRELAISSIVPNSHQPREVFDEDSLEGLVASVTQLGVLQPILVRQIGAGEFEIIAGERRWRAAKRAGLESIPALIRDAADQRSLEEALVENLQRDDLNPIEEALAFSRLGDFGLTQQEVADRVGRSRSAIANSLRLLHLVPKVQKLLVNRELSPGHARALLAVKDADSQVSLARKACKEDWTVRQLESCIRDKSKTSARGDADGRNNGKSPAAQGGSGSAISGRPVAIAELEDLLAEYLSTSVSVSFGSGKSKITVDFANLDDLERIYRRIVT